MSGITCCDASATVRLSQSRKSTWLTSASLLNEPTPLVRSSTLMRPKAKKRGPKEPCAGSSHCGGANATQRCHRMAPRQGAATRRAESYRGGTDPTAVSLHARDVT